MLVFVKIPKMQRTHNATVLGIWQAAKDGIRMLKSVRGMFALMLIGALYAIIYFPIGTLYPLITMAHFGGGISESGVVEVLFAVGTLAGASLLGIFGERINKIGAIIASITIYGMGVLATGLLPPSGLKVFMGLSLVMGISVPFYTGVQTSIFQMKIGEEYLGRALSTSSSISMVAMPLGLVLSGTFAEFVGIANWFLASGIMTLIIAAMAFTLPSLKSCCKT